MKVRLHGFALEAHSKRVGVEELFLRLQADSGRVMHWGKMDRILLVKNVEGYAIGLFVTVKDQKTLTELVEEKGVLKLQARQLEEGTSMVDFNYLVLNTATGRGLYQHYHSACKFTRFGAFLADRYAQMVREQAEHQIIRAGGAKLADHARSQIRSEFAGYLDYMVLTRPEKLDELLTELVTIKRFTYDIATVEDDGDDAETRPFSGLVRKVRKQITFEKKDQPVQLLRRQILDLIDRVRPVKGRIEGRDFQNKDQVFDLDSNVDILREYEYDEVAGEILIELGTADKPNWSFVESPMVERMMKVVADHPSLFDSPEVDE